MGTVITQHRLPWQPGAERPAPASPTPRIWAQPHPSSCEQVRASSPGDSQPVTPGPEGRVGEGLEAVIAEAQSHAGSCHRGSQPKAPGSDPLPLERHSSGTSSGAGEGWVGA